LLAAFVIGKNSERLAGVPVVDLPTF